MISTSRLAILVTCLLFIDPPASLSAQTREPTIQQARVHLRAREFDAAIQILQGITAREPDNARAWALLGYSLHGKGEYRDALDAHLKAAEFERTAPTAMYNAGLAYALLGQPDQAFEWLMRARDTGRIDMTQIHFDDDAESLRADPRYTRLFPSREEFTDPFVEDVKILQHWIGEAAGGSFGWIARNIGDVDGDGIDDVTTSAPSLTVAGPQAGKVYVYSSRTGELLWSRAGKPGDRIGLGIEAAGDVNADGVPDVIAGAPGADKTYVLSGRDGAVVLTLEAQQPGELFGRKVSDVGDVNGDGHADVIVGAPQNDAGGEDAGRAYLFSGKDGALMLTLGGEVGDRYGSAVAGYRDRHHLFLVVGAPDAGPDERGRTYVYKDLSGDPAFVIESDETGAELGAMFVSVVGDTDADGVPDIYASDWSNAAQGGSTGRIYVHSGADGRRLLTLTGEAAGDGFGIGPADLGDVNGDGHDDLIIGAWRHSGAAPAGGKVYIHSGADGGLLRSYTCKVMGDTFGFDATGIGDVDGDGAIDYLLTSAWSFVNGPRSGRLFILAGK